MKDPLWLEVSAAGRRPPCSSTSSDTISPHSPSCSCPSPGWFPFLDWSILNKHLPQDLQISCCLAKMHCPRYAHGPRSLILKVSVQISPCSQALPKYTWKLILPFDFLHQTSFCCCCSYHLPSDTLYNFCWLIFCHQNGILGAFVFSTLHSLQWQYWDFVTIQFIFLRCMKEFFIKTRIHDILVKTLVCSMHDKTHYNIVK